MLPESAQKAKAPKQTFRIADPAESSRIRSVSVNQGQAYALSTVYDALKYLLFTPLSDVFQAGLTSRESISGENVNNSTNARKFTEEEFWVRAKRASKYYKERLVEYPTEYRRDVFRTLYAMYAGTHKEDVTFSFMLRVLAQNYTHDARSMETNLLTSALVMTMQISEPMLSRICPKTCIGMSAARPASAQACAKIMNMIVRIDENDNTIFSVFRKLYHIAYSCDLFA